MRDTALERTRHRRFPITTVAQTLLDFAATAPIKRVRRALAEAEYRGLLDPRAVAAILGQGRPGSAKLRRALERPQPRLADTRSPTEEAFIALCESADLPIPEVNVMVEGWKVDFLWRAVGVVVEVDGHGNHHTPAQLDRDRRKELALRSAGLVVNRYGRRQVEQTGDLVIADVAATLAERRSRLSPAALSA